MFPGDYSRHRVDLVGQKRVYVGGLWGFDSASEALEAKDDEDVPAAPLGHAALKFLSDDGQDDEEILEFIEDDDASFYSVGSLALLAGDGGDSHNFLEESVFTEAKAALKHLRARGLDAIAAVFLDDAAKAASNPRVPRAEPKIAKKKAAAKSATNHTAKKPAAEPARTPSAPAPGDFSTVNRTPPTDGPPAPDPRKLNVVHRGVYFFVAALRTATGRALTTPYPDLAQLIADELAADPRAMSDSSTVTALLATTLDFLTPWRDLEFASAIEAEIQAAKGITGASEQVARVIRDAVEFFEAFRKHGTAETWLEEAALTKDRWRAGDYGAAFHAHRQGWPIIPALVGRGHDGTAIREAMLTLWPEAGTKGTSRFLLKSSGGPNRFYAALEAWSTPPLSLAS